MRHSIQQLITSASEDAFNWLMAHREVLLTVKPPNSFRDKICLGAIDLRLDYGVELASQTVETMLNANGSGGWVSVEPQADLPTERMRAEMFAVMLQAWAFPDDFVANERAIFEAHCTVGGQYRDRDVMVVAYGHKVQVGQTHPNEFKHAIVTARLS